jgi:isoleucyl-tRNA synthetase
VSLEIDPTVTPEQIREGLAREITRKIQAARKSADFKFDDRIELQLHAVGALREAAEAHREMICSETLTVKFSFSEQPTGAHTEVAETDEGTIKIGVTPVARA